MFTRLAIRPFHRWPLAALALVSLAALLAASNPQPSKYISFHSLPAGWQISLLNHGDRLLKPGKERLVLSGTTTRQNYASLACQITYELPNQVRYQEQGSGAETLVFDGSQFSSNSASLQKADTDLMETLAYDSPDWFFYVPANTLPWRKLGSRFMINPQPGTRYTGPVYDIYLVSTSIQQPGKVKRQSKYYYVNSDSNLMERVQYQDADNPSTNVDVILGGWTTIANNRVPQTIQRMENGVEVFHFTVTSAVIGAAMADGAFQKP